MSVKAYITRSLDVCLIDARSVINRAKISLGIQGYPTLKQNMEVQREAIKIFEEHPFSARRGMKCLKVDLGRVKSADGTSSEFSALGAPTFPHSRCS
jgi:hypothetical protein